MEKEFDEFIEKLKEFVKFREDFGQISGFEVKLISKEIDKLAEEYKKKNKLIQRRCPDVFIERAAECTREGLQAICGTDKEYSAYVKKFMKRKNKN